MINLKKIKLKIILLLIIINLLTITKLTEANNKLNFKINSKTTTPSNILIFNFNNELKKSFLKKLKDNLEVYEQLSIEIINYEKKQELKDLSKQIKPNTDFICLLSKKNNLYSWKLYSAHNLKLLKKETLNIKKQYCSNSDLLAAQIYSFLFNHPGCFCSKIAFSKEIVKQFYNTKTKYKQIFYSNIHCKKQKPLVASKHIAINPTWFCQYNNPLLFYSETTLSNIELCVTNMFNKKQIIANFDGLNIQPKFSFDNKKMVFCTSKEGSSQIYSCGVKNLGNKNKYKKLTSNSGNNVSPCFIKNHKIAFVSDFESKQPLIYTLNLKNKKLKKLISNGYSNCPNYCAKKNQLVFSKIVNSKLQLCIYDFATKNEAQLTASDSNKEEPSWSSCGNFIFFENRTPNCSQLARLNILNNKIKLLTPPNENYSYPSCSPNLV